MKHFIFALVLGLFFISCDSNVEDPHNPAANIPIVGKWKLVEAKKEFRVPVVVDYNANNITYLFKENGNLDVIGDDNLGYNSGSYTYTYGTDYLSDNPASGEQQQLIVKIDGKKWRCTIDDGKLELSTGYIDGPTLFLTK